jgi:long-chain acyl-CoA synthetase
VDNAVWISVFLVLVVTFNMHGDPKESCLVAVFGIDPVTFAPYAGKILKKPVQFSS